MAGLFGVGPSVGAWLPRAHLSRPAAPGTGPSRPALPPPRRCSSSSPLCVPEPAAAVHVGASVLRLAGQAVPPPASRARVLRRPAHRDDAEGDAQQLPLRHRHRVPERHARYATLDGVVRLESFRPETVAVVGRDGHTEFQYWHIRPAVANGQRVQRLPHRRRLGAGAVGARALLRDARRRLRQPAAAGRPRPVRRRDAAVDQAASRLGWWIRDLYPRDPRTVELVVEAYDETPDPRPRPLGRQARHARAPSLARDAAPAATSCRAGGRRSTTGSRSPRTISSRAQYARWTRQNKRNRIGRYRFVLAAAWDTRTLADGRYVVEVTASDVSGNTTVARFPVQIANRGARV